MQLESDRGRAGRLAASTVGSAGRVVRSAGCGFGKRTRGCDGCGRPRTLNGAGMCHECTVAEMEAAVSVDAEGNEWVPGGCRL